MGTLPTTFQYLLRETLWWVGQMEGRKEEKLEERFFARPAKAENYRLGVNTFTKVFISSLGHTKSARLGPPASAGYF